MPEYINSNTYAVHLIGPDGRTIKINKNQRTNLPEYYNKYCARGFIQLLSDYENEVIHDKNVRQQSVEKGRVVLDEATKKAQAILAKKEEEQRNKEEAQVKKLARSKVIRNKQIGEARKQQEAALEMAKHIPGIVKHSIKGQRRVLRNLAIQKAQKKQVLVNYIDDGDERKIVGKLSRANANEIFQKNIEEFKYPVSNNIGIGILSYNRPDILHRLIRSIVSYTDLHKTTIFISDDNSDNKELLKYLDDLNSAATPNFVILKNNKRIGIAGNTNRLLRCLSRFKYGMLLNDDVEILRYGWDQVYFDAMENTGMHHFIYQQLGVYNASVGDSINVGETKLLKVEKRPHGAVMAFTNDLLSKIGYFDESFGFYGMEHVDWSQRAYECGMQEAGFYDIEISKEYFKIHSESSAVKNRQKLLREAREIFKNREPGRFVQSSDKTLVPTISYVVPFKNVHRQSEIITVLNNVRAQRFPCINIVAIEQDPKANMDIDKIQPVLHDIDDGSGNDLFNKARAFNLGLTKIVTDKVVLHDADMIVPGHYTSLINSILDDHEACHIGNRVLYTTKDSTSNITNTGVISNDVKCDRVVSYFEGGSLACRTKVYWKVGGFNEDYWGYGCEDCDFYQRLVHKSKWFGDRTLDLLHLWHSRVPNWGAHHRANKELEARVAQAGLDGRIDMQYDQLRQNGYEDYLNGALNDE
jgi:GT2 family glycosyltransferase